jgi:hypothetical protein
MSLRYDPSLYGPSSFDEDMCLKPPLLLWIAVAYLARAILLPIVIGIGHFSGVDERAFSVLRPLWSTDALAPAAAALPLLYAMLRRAPTAADATRWIWARGRVFLGASAALDATLSCFHFLHDSGDSQFVLMSGAALDAYFLVYILGARRVRDTFTDFPPPRESAARR